MEKYDESSRVASVGDGFGAYVMQMFHVRTGMTYRGTRQLVDFGFTSTEVNEIEQSEGDIFLPTFHVFLECKTSEKWKDSVCISRRGRDVFSGPHKFYVTSFFDGKDYVDIRFHSSKLVKKEAVLSENGEYYTFDTAQPSALTFDEFRRALRRVQK